MSQMMGKQAYVPENDEIDLSAILNQLSEYRWLILLVTIATLGLGVFYASRQVPQYQSDVLLQIEAGQSSLGQTGAMAQQFLFRSPTGDATSTQIALMQSRFILEPVVNSLGLDISATPKKRGMWSRLTSFRKPTIQVPRFEVPHEQINQRFTLVFDKPAHVSLFDAAGHLLIQGATGSLMTNANKTIRLQVDGIQAPLGTQFSLVKRSDLPVVNALSHRLKIEESGSKTRQNTGILSIALSGDDPTKIVQTLNAIARVAQKKDAQKKSKEAAQTLEFLYHQLPITKGQLEQAESALNRYRAKSGKIDIKLQTQFLLNQLADLDKQLSVLGINKLDMLQRYTLEHPTLIALDTQTKALEAQRNQLEKGLKTLPASDQIAVNLKREVGVKKALYLILLGKIQELEVVKDGTVSSVHILSFASLPDAPLPGKNAMIYMGSILLGLMLSAMIIVGRRLISPRVDDPHWGERHYNMANLAIIPYCKEQTQNALDVKANPLQPMPLLAHANPRNLSIESLRSLRTSLQVTLAGASNNILAILGVSPGVGKSFVSANLAYLLAAGGKRVLLIDGDLRRGTLHKYMNVSPTPGLAEVLNQTTPIGNALMDTLHQNLTFLPRGTYPSNPSELLMSDYFKALMSSFSHQYDVVVIDTAPVLLVTDAVLIGAVSATNYLVMGAGAHQPADVEMVMKRLTGSGVQVQGSIFNFYRSETLSRSYGQYGKYGKYGKYNTYYYDDTMKN